MDLAYKRQWVADGGVLICEGCPAYFGDRGKVGTLQPNQGLDEVFGAVEDQVDFMPDISGELMFAFDGTQVRGGIYSQSYKAAGGRIRGQYADGTTAVVEHIYGKGKTLLVGTFPSAGYYQQHDSGNLEYFTKVVDWAGVNPHVKLTHNGLQVRLSRQADGNVYMWMINPDRAPRSALIELSDEYREWSADRVYWGADEWSQQGSGLQVTVPERDALVVGLKRKH